MTDQRASIAASHPRLHVPIHLRWGDLDAFNHVNNTAMLKLLEEARVRAFWRSGAIKEEHSTAVLESGLASGLLTLIARQEIVYLAPVPYQRDPLDIQMWFGKIGGSSLEVCYEVYSPIGAVPPVLYARANTVVVKADAVSGRPVRFTDEERAAFEGYLGEPINVGRR